MNNILDYGVDYGVVVNNIREIMNYYKINSTQLSKLSNIRYRTINNYCEEEIFRLDKDNLARLCYVFNCDIDTILLYLPSLLLEDSIPIKSKGISSIDNNYYGTIKLRLKEIMDKMNISINRMSLLSKLKYETVYNYYYDQIQLLDLDILAKFCYILNCKITDIVKYEKVEVFILQ